MRTRSLPASVLVTGGDGLLGRHALLAWHDACEIYALVRHKPRRPVPNVCYIPVDLSSEWDCRVLPKRIDAVIHLAQASNPRAFPGEAADIFEIGVASTAKLLEYARQAGAHRFVYASTGGLYAPSQEPLTETSPLAPPTGPLRYYFAAKRSSELLVQAYSEVMQTVVLRPFFIYGPGQRESMLIPRLLRNVITGSPIALAGGVGTRLNPIHAVDAVRALAACLNNAPPPLLNIAGPDILTIKEIAEIIGDAVNKAPVFDIRDTAPEVIVSDIELLKSLVPVPLHSLAGSLKSILTAGGANE